MIFEKKINNKVSYHFTIQKVFKILQNQVFILNNLFQFILTFKSVILRITIYYYILYILYPCLSYKIRG
jgi:hypothetical protein